MKAKAILVIGMPGSGKDEFANVAKEIGVEVINMGDIVREYTINSGLDISKSGDVASMERKLNGMDIWAKRTIKRIKSNFVVIEGIRNVEEIERFRKDIEIGLVVGIASGRGNRYDRLILRGRGDDPHNIEEFNAREQRELSWGIG
ncbi:MAG: AAA family ATPase, partial [Thermoplasmatales archaeon]